MGFLKAVLTVASFAVRSAVARDDMDKSMEQLCLENGFKSEMYTLVTQDDYVLSMYRIPGKFTDDLNAEAKPAVLMVHCQDCDMMEWFWNDPSKSNAFILANAGYDVWMGNNRGSKYSKGHLSLTPKDKAYWDFYQEDMATQDLPTFVDFVQEKTGQEKISYIGHSEGTTQMFLGASMNPDYFKERINLYIALAPVASTANIPIGYIRFAAHYIRLLELIIVHHFNYFNWFAPMPLTTDFVGVACHYFSGICNRFASLLDHEGVDNGSRFPMFISNEPSGSSYRTFVYYAQMINSGNFSLYDYGKIKNHQVYGQGEPPLVPIQDFDIPVALFSGSLDKLADPVDVAWLSDQLGDKVVFQQQYHLDHFSFALAKDMTWFSTDAVDLLNQYNNYNI